jgi:hypothetical protein
VCDRLAEEITVSCAAMRTTIPGPAYPSETLPKCRGIARTRLARLHTTVRETARELTVPAFKPAAKAVKRTTKAQDAAAKETRTRRRFLKWTSAPGGENCNYAWRSQRAVWTCWCREHSDSKDQARVWANAHSRARSRLSSSTLVSLSRRSTVAFWLCPNS